MPVPPVCPSLCPRWPPCPRPYDQTTANSQAPTLLHKLYQARAENTTVLSSDLDWDSYDIQHKCLLILVSRIRKAFLHIHHIHTQLHTRNIHNTPPSNSTIPCVVPLRPTTAHHADISNLASHQTSPISISSSPCSGRLVQAVHSVPRKRLAYPTV